MISLVLILVVTAIFNVLEKKLWYSINFMDILIIVAALFLPFVVALILVVVAALISVSGKFSDNSFLKSQYEFFNTFIIGGYKNIDNKN